MVSTEIQDLREREDQQERGMEQMRMELAKLADENQKFKREIVNLKHCKKVAGKAHQTNNHLVSNSLLLRKGSLGNMTL